METAQAWSFVRGVLVVGVALVAGSPGLAQTASAEEIASGKRVYSFYCATCHGEQGHGDGPTAAFLTVRPADLTRLAARHGGSFPAEDVRRTIDGRETVPGHGTREMPIWGLAFQDLESAAGQEHDVRARIRSLVEYLRSTQD